MSFGTSLPNSLIHVKRPPLVTAAMRVGPIALAVEFGCWLGATHPSWIDSQANRLAASTALFVLLISSGFALPIKTLRMITNRRILNLGFRVWVISASVILLASFAAWIFQQPEISTMCWVLAVTPVANTSLGWAQLSIDQAASDDSKSNETGVAAILLLMSWVPLILFLIGYQCFAAPLVIAAAFTESVVVGITGLATGFLLQHVPLARSIGPRWNRIATMIAILCLNFLAAYRLSASTGWTLQLEAIGVLIVVSLTVLWVARRVFGALPDYLASPASRATVMKNTGLVTGVLLTSGIENIPVGAIITYTLVQHFLAALTLRMNHS